MEEDLHEKATALFGKAMELELDEAKEFIQKETGNNIELKEYTLKLYASFIKEKETFPEVQSTLSAHSIHQLINETENQNQRLLFFQKKLVKHKKNISVVIIAFFLITSGFVYGTYIREQLIGLECNEHLAILRANETILKQWIRSEKMKVEDISNLPIIKEITSDLSLKYEEWGKNFVEKAYNKITHYTPQLNQISKREEILGVGILHRSAPITLISNALLSKHRLSVLNGKMLGEGVYATYLKVIEGETVFTPPLELNQQIFDTADKVDNYASECHFSSPIYQDGKIEGVFTMSLSSKETFGQLFKSTIHGSSSEVYAFNRRGKMLSTSRFLSELQQENILDTTKTSILNIELKAPNTQKSTLLFQRIDEDLNQKNPFYHGMITNPYKNYLGNEVIGAWVWFPSLNIGLIHEQNYDEFNRSVFLFDITYLLSVCLILIFGVIIIRGNFKLNLLQKKYTTLKELGQYHLKEKIGEGGFGEVYKGEHRLLKKPVAIKVLKKEFNSTDTLDRFKKEVMITASLEHPNTIKVYDYGTGKEGEFYYVMEHLNGLSLENILYHEEIISVNRGVYILLKVCKSLEEAHKKGLLHRDIKPANIMVCNQGGAVDIIKLLDFGLVKDVNSPLSQQTQINRIGGTPMFMAPERIHDPYNTDARQDIYAIGAVGLYIFSGKYIVELISQKMLMGQESIDDLLTQDIFKDVSFPKQLIQLIFSCVSFDVNERPENISLLIKELETIVSDYPWTERDAQKWWFKYDEYS